MNDLSNQPCGPRRAEVISESTPPSSSRRLFLRATGLAAAGLAGGFAAPAASANSVSVAPAPDKKFAIPVAPPDSTYVTQGQTVLDIRRQPGVMGDGVTDDTVAIQSALDSAASLGIRAFARGVFRIGSTIKITGNVDLIDASIIFTGTGTALRVGSSGTYLMRKSIKLPEVLAAAKTSIGWAQVSGSIGVDVCNVYASQIEIPHIRNFETGLRLYGHSSLGTSYCNITVGHLSNNKINLLFSADSASAGYCNQNTIYGGRYSHESDEGRNAAGTCHIQLAAFSTTGGPNNNVFINPSVESPSVVEWAIDLQAGAYNQWVSPRLEFTDGTSKIRWGAQAVRNLIIGGNQIDSLVETWVPGATLNSIIGTSFHRMMTSGAKGGLVLENTAGNASPALTILRPTGTQLGDDPATAYGTRLEYSGARFKRYTDAAERVRIDGSAGRLLIGNGATPPVAGFYGVGPFLLFAAGSTTVGFEADNSTDIGSATNYRPRYVRAGTAIQTAAVARGARPSAATARAGAMVFDTTLGKPIWSTGSRWVDANGLTV